MTANITCNNFSMNGENKSKIVKQWPLGNLYHPFSKMIYYLGIELKLFSNFANILS